jgi:hypothetical protein
MQMRVSNMIVAYSPYYPYGRQLDTAGLAANLQNDNVAELLGQVLLGANSFGGYVAPGLFDPNTYGNARSIVANITNVTLLKQSLSYITGDSTNPAPGIIKSMVNGRIAALQK